MFKIYPLTLLSTTSLSLSSFDVKGGTTWAIFSPVGRRMLRIVKIVERKGYVKNTVLTVLLILRVLKADNFFHSWSPAALLSHLLK